MVDSLLVVAAMMNSLFMSIYTGVEGVGREDISISNTVLAAIAIELASWKPIRRLATSAV